MANIVKIKMDKERHLKFNMTTIMEMEAYFNKPIMEVQENQSVTNLIKLFYFGLKWEDKKLEIEKTADLLDLAIEEYEGMEEPSKLLGQALASAFGNTAVPSKK